MPGDARDRSAINDADQAWHMLSSMLSGPIAWGLIGFLADRWLGTEPWLLVAGVVLGFVLGFYLVVKRSEAVHTPRQRRGHVTGGSVEGRRVEGRP